MHGRLKQCVIQVVTHCTPQQLEGVADALWTPLFENPENSEENTRNVAAACLGKLTTIQPSTYLPLLQACQIYLIEALIYLTPVIPTGPIA